MRQYIVTILIDVEGDDGNIKDFVGQIDQWPHDVLIANKDYRGNPFEILEMEEIPKDET